MDRYDMPKLLFSLLLVAYIVWWFYALFTTIIPWLNVAVSNTLGLTWLQIIGSALFFGLGIPGLFVCIFVLLVFIAD